MAARLSRRASNPDGDRLATAVFIAALVHGLFIMGVRFSAPALEAPAMSTLEILLVPTGPDEPAPNDDAAYLAQRAQQGSGTGPEARRSSLPEARPQPPPDAADPPADPERPAAVDPLQGHDSVLARRELDAERLPSGTEAPDAQLFVAPAPPATPAVGLDVTAHERELHLRGQRSHDGKLLADTRESAIAAYLDGWKRRIERVGTLNFPNEARRRRMSGNPVLEVAIRADGSLESVVVRRSSGHSELDQAAVGIVRLAAPFDPFSTTLRERYPVLRFAYEWQFLDGRLGGDGAVFTPRP